MSISNTDIALTQAVSNLAVAAEVLERVGKTTRQSTKPAAPRRGLSRTEAANYIGVSPTKFDTMVKTTTMPAPVRIGSRTVWDILALDEAFDILAAPTGGNSWDNWR